MKKVRILLLILTVICLSMIFFVGNMVEEEIKLIFKENQQSDFSVKILTYNRNFFSADVISQMKIHIDPQTTLTFNITSRIFHYPYQAVIKNNISLADEILAEKVQRYFGTPDWLISEEKIDLFSQLTGVLIVASGKYSRGSESFATEPLLVSYQFDLKNKSGEMQVDLLALTGVTSDIAVMLSALQLNVPLGRTLNKNEHDYKLSVGKVAVKKNNHHSVLEGFVLKGRSQQGEKEHTLDMVNEFSLDSYQFNTNTVQTFINNRIKFSLTGLYQPAFEQLNSGSDDMQEVERALFALIYNGAQLTLSQLTSQTPWGEVDGEFDLTLDPGVSLNNAITNPYILLDYISGDANLMLPVSLLELASLKGFLEMGLITGILLQKEQTLNLDTSFLQGELIVNGQVIPL